MALHEHLAAIKAKSKLPEETVAVMKRTRADLAASGQADAVPAIGDRAPDIVLPNIYGDVVSTAKILEKGPLVLHFFRGVW